MPMVVAPLAGLLVGPHRRRPLMFPAWPAGGRAGLVRGDPRPGLGYGKVVVPFIMAGTGMALVFAPAANAVLSSVRTRRPARRRARPTRSARSAACSGSPCWRRCSPARARSPRRRRSATGCSPPCWSARRAGARRDRGAAGAREGACTGPATQLRRPSDGTRGGCGARHPPLSCGRCRSCSPTTTGSTRRGLQALRRALAEVPGVELAVIAPDCNRSATARSITTRRPIWVEEVDFGDGSVGYATDGTPVDCVRFATLGLVEGFDGRPRRLRDQPRLQPRRRHHLLRHGRRRAGGRSSSACRRSPSRSSPRARELDFRLGARVRLRHRRGVHARAWSRSSRTCRCRRARCSTSTSPAGEPEGVEVTRLGKRIYRDELAARGGGRATAGACTASTATRPASTTRRAPTSRPSPRAGSPSPDPLRPDGPRGHGRAAPADLARLLRPAAREVE